MTILRIAFFSDWYRKGKISIVMVNLPVEAALPQQGTEERLQIYAVVIYNFYDSGSSLWIDKIFVTDCDHDGYLLSLDTRLIGD